MLPGVLLLPDLITLPAGQVERGVAENEEAGSRRGHSDRRAAGETSVGPVRSRGRCNVHDVAFLTPPRPRSPRSSATPSRRKGRSVIASYMQHARALTHMRQKQVAVDQAVMLQSSIDRMRSEREALEEKVKVWGHNLHFRHTAESHTHTCRSWRAAGTGRGGTMRGRPS